MINFYQVLGVKQADSPEEIKKAYHRRAKFMHPDRNSNSIESKKSFELIQKAYDVLSISDKRIEYDQMLYEQNKPIPVSLSLTEHKSIVSKQRTNSFWGGAAATIFIAWLFNR